MKKICILLLAAVLLFAACSKHNNNTGSVSNNDEMEVSAPAESDNTPAGSGNDPDDNDNLPVDEEPVPSEEDNLFTNEYNPVIIAVKDDEGKLSKGYIIGGSKNGKWLDLDELELDLVKGGETYKLYDENGLVTSCKGGKPELYISPISERKSLTLELDPIESGANFLIGISGGWYAIPDEPAVLSEETPLRLDMNNDGDDETISLVNNGLQNDAFGNEVEELAVNIIDSDKIIFVCNILYNEIETLEYKVLPMDMDGDNDFEIVVVEYGIKTTVRIFDVKDDIADLVLICHIGDDN